MKTTRQEAALKEARQALADSDYPLITDAVVGSAYILGNEDSAADIDVLCLVSDKCRHRVSEMSFEGWGYGGSAGEGHQDFWGSWTKGSTNLLVTDKREYFNAWCTAAEVCRLLHLAGVHVPKGERVAIHNIIMDDSDADAEMAWLVEHNRAVSAREAARPSWDELRDGIRKVVREEHAATEGIVGLHILDGKASRAPDLLRVINTGTELLFEDTRYVVIDTMQNFHTRALAMPLGGGAPRWFSNSEVIAAQEARG